MPGDPSLESNYLWRGNSTSQQKMWPVDELLPSDRLVPMKALPGTRLPPGARCSHVPHFLTRLLLWHFCGHQVGSSWAHQAQMAVLVPQSPDLTQRHPHPGQCV